MENAARLCNLDTLSIALSKLQGAPLKSANYLESKEVRSGKTLVWSSLKKHLTGDYSEIPYHTHAINAYESLQQGNNESTEAYLHRAQDILEHIHHTNDMSSITTIGTNHAKILTGLKDIIISFKVGQLIAVKYHLRNIFDTRFISDYRMLKIINECTLLTESPDGKIRKNNINDTKPVSAITATDNALQEFRQSMLRRSTLTLMHYIVLPHKYEAAQ